MGLSSGERTEGVARFAIVLGGIHVQPYHVERGIPRDTDIARVSVETDPS